MDSLRKAVISLVNRVVIVPVLSTDNLRKAVTSLMAAISPVADSSLAADSSRVAIRDVLRVALVLKRRSRSHTIPMLSTL